MKAWITDFKKFAVHDGDGIRTTVFFKGCPLKCKWCHNPETISRLPEIGLYAHKCVLCGACASVCKNHKIVDGKHIYLRENCTNCKKCVDVCLAEALVPYGRECTTEEICDILLEDADFYETSGGGITLSGGECLLQPDACAEILKTMKQMGIRTAVDTCGMVKWESIAKVIDYTDVFLYDVKAIDEDIHKMCTGMSNRQILENLARIDAYGKKIEIRIPYVPQYNDDQIEKIVDMVKTLKNVVRVRVLAYHDLARSKYNALGAEDTLPAVIPTEEELAAARLKFTVCGIPCSG